MKTIFSIRDTSKFKEYTYWSNQSVRNLYDIRSVHQHWPAQVDILLSIGRYAEKNCSLRSMTHIRINSAGKWWNHKFEVIFFWKSSQTLGSRKAWSFFTNLEDMTNMMPCILKLNVNEEQTKGPRRSSESAFSMNI